MFYLGPIQVLATYLKWSIDFGQVPPGGTALKSRIRSEISLVVDAERVTCRTLLPMDGTKGQREGAERPADRDWKDSKLTPRSVPSNRCDDSGQVRHTMLPCGVLCEEYPIFSPCRVHLYSVHSIVKTLAASWPW